VKPIVCQGQTLRGSTGSRSGRPRGTSSVDNWIAFPTHALLIVEERLREQQAEGMRMPDGVPLDELALRALISAETGRFLHSTDDRLGD
jgi:hypothetical protein